jgi:hypothetical protein
LTEQPHEAPAGGAPRRQLAGAVLLYLALALLLTASVWSDPGHRWVGICCDQEQSIWFLAWLPSAIEHGQNPLVTDRLNAPDGANLMWNAASPLLAAVMAPITLTAGPILAYNLAVLLAIASSGLACFLALRRWVHGSLGPLIGGALYAMSPYIASQAVLHLNLLSAWGPPLFLVLFDELLVRRDRRPEVLGIAIGVVAALQLLTFEEVLATSAVAAVLLAIVLALVVRDRAWISAATRRGLRAAGPALATFLLIGGFPLAVQFFGPLRIEAPVQDASTFSTDLLNLVLPTPYQLVAPAQATAISTHFSGLYHEATAYVGLPLLLIVGWILVARRTDRRLRVAASMAAIMFVLSLGPQLHVTDAATGIPMPWLAIGQLPLLGHVVPGRLTLYMWLAIAAMVAIAIEHATEMTGRRGIVRLAAIGLALVFVLPAPERSWTAEIPPFFSSWGQQGIARTDTILIAPWFTDGAGADPMLWAAIGRAEPRLHEGYVYVPDALGRPRYGPARDRIASLMVQIQDTGAAVVARGQARVQAISDLEASGISVVIVGPMPHRAEMVAFFTELLGAPPTETGGVEIWRDMPGLLASMRDRAQTEEGPVTRALFVVSWSGPLRDAR